MKAWEVLAKKMLEADLQRNVEQALDTFGYRRYHTHDSRRSQEGFPDIVAIRDKLITVAELKSQKGELSRAQREWLYLFHSAGARVFIWRPRDWFNGSIVDALR